jgi:hypothetical protein
MHPALRCGDCRSGAGVRCGRRRLVFALSAASGDSSSEPDHSPGSHPRRLGVRHRRPCRAPTGADSFLHCHQRRHSAPGLRTGRNRSTREDGLRPCVTTDKPDGPAPDSGDRVPGLRRGAGRSEGFAVLRTSMNGQIAKRRAKLIATGGVGLAVVGPGRGHDELQRPRSPRWRRNGSGVISTAAGGHIRSRGRGRSAWPVRTSGPVPFPGAFCSLWRYLRPCALRDGLVVGHP